MPTAIWRSAGSPKWVRRANLPPIPGLPLAGVASLAHSQAAANDAKTGSRRSLNGAFNWEGPVLARSGHSPRQYDARLDSDDAEIARLIKEAQKRRRGYADFFSWPPNRDVEEANAVALSAAAMEKSGSRFFEKVRGRGRGSDPPDVEAVDLSGSGRGGGKGIFAPFIRPRYQGLSAF